MSQHETSRTVPEHVGVIIDGNRRWARNSGLSTLEGHRRGYDLVMEIAEHACSRGVQVLSAYMFSTENWKREPDELGHLMDELSRVTRAAPDRLASSDIRLRFLHGAGRLPDTLDAAMAEAEAQTADRRGGTLALCVDYGGQQELADAAAALVAEGITPADISPEVFGRYVYAPDVPGIDLLIRTGGERRLSNFMLWRAAYAELSFFDKYWPAFTTADLDRAMSDFAHRQRRFGR